MAKAIKLLVSAFENSGKSTLTSSIKDALVINFDKKEYSFSVPHVNIKEYTGMQALLTLINEKIKAYQDKFKKYPSVIVFDTITQLYTAIINYNNSKFKGFEIHNKNNADTLAFNDYIENILIPNGVSVVIVAHTTFDADTNRYTIPSQGQFAKAGSWLSVVNDAIFLEKNSNKIQVYLSGLNRPARSTLKDLPEKIDIGEYDINDHILKLLENKIEAVNFEL